jgi:hypothetical protein
MIPLAFQGPVLSLKSLLHNHNIDKKTLELVMDELREEFPYDEIMVGP